MHTKHYIYYQLKWLKKKHISISFIPVYRTAMHFISFNILFQFMSTSNDSDRCCRSVSVNLGDIEPYSEIRMSLFEFAPYTWEIFIIYHHTIGCVICFNVEEIVIQPTNLTANG